MPNSLLFYTKFPSPPHGLYIQGELPTNDLALAIVGTRKATGEGLTLAREFSSTLATAGITIVSGLALGIDGAAHKGALEAHGKTLAVVARGLDKYYPATHEKLAEDIISHGGTIISEYPLGSPALPHRFLERNRIVSGLSKGVIVIEAPQESGALATARFALEQNRDVFVVQGPAHHPNFQGSHDLIRSGAELVTLPTHVLMAYGIETKENAEFVPSPENHEEALILKTLRSSSKPLMVDKIIELTNLEAKKVNQTVSLLVLKDIIKEDGEGYYIVK